MRVLHHPKSTEDAYVSWVARSIRHLDDERLEKFGEPEIGHFLTDLAVIGEVAAGRRMIALTPSPWPPGRMKERRIVKLLLNSPLPPAGQ
jgi:hypothetical protein